MNTETVIGYIKANPGATKATISENTGAKGIVLHNILQKLISDGFIVGTGEAKNATYEATDAAMEETSVVNETSEQAVVSEDEQANKGTAGEGESQPQVETEDGKKNQQPAAKASASRNNDKFKFNGQEGLGKGPLCRELIKKAVADNPGITIKKLKEMFPDELIPRFGVFQDVEKAREISGQKYDRYFFKDEHVIKLKDKKVVVCNQLTSSLCEKIIARAKELGYKIK